jgi:large subunit ribosomal protein L30
VPEKTGTIHIKWVRSGIGFPRRQKEVVKSIGLRHLNQVVARPDTAHMRGLVAKVPHLVEVVVLPASPAWANIPEYKIVPAEDRPKKPARAEKAAKETPAELPVASESVEAAATAPLRKPAAVESKAVAARKKAGATKSRAGEPSKKAASAGAEKPKPRRKAAEPKPAAKKESKPKKGKK